MDVGGAVSHLHVEPDLADNEDRHWSTDTRDCNGNWDGVVSCPAVEYPRICLES